MAKQQEYRDDPRGIIFPESYHRLNYVALNKGAKTADLSLLIYANKTIADSPIGQPINSHDIRIAGEDYDNFFAITPLEENNVFKQSYLALAIDPYYTNSIDV